MMMKLRNSVLSPGVFKSIVRIRLAFEHMDQCHDAGCVSQLRVCQILHVRVQSLKSIRSSTWLYQRC